MTSMTTISADELDALFSFAVWMFGTRESAAAALLAVAHDTPDGGRDDWLGRMWRARPAQRQRATSVRLQALDSVLRDQMTMPVGLDHPLVRGEPRRLRVLRAEVERACLAAVVHALPPMPRAVFLMDALFEMGLAEIAGVLGVDVANAQAAHRKAERALDDYLGSRCEHLDRRNVCRCAGRVGVALERGFIRWPEHDEHGGAPGVRAPGLAALIAALPKFRRDASVAGLTLASRV